MDSTSLIHVIRVGMQEAMMRRGKHFLFLILEYFFVNFLLVCIPFSNYTLVHIQ
tara:strand:- start:3549 stop:3710 length:162 start_codon:yes stop_codon:yes gene_type:complete